MLKPTRLLIALLLLTIAAYSHADDVIIGKVVAVADGDTITVLKNLTPVSYTHLRAHET